MTILSTGVATEFINFTRASNATVTDSDGKVKWAPHNLLLASEQFNASAWNSTSGVTVTANSTSAPNSTTTSDTLAFTTAGYHYQTLSIGSAVTNTTYTMGVWLWSATGKTQIVMRLHGQTTSTDQTVQAVTLTSTPTLFTISRTFTSTDTAIVAGLDNRTVAGGDGIAGNVIAWGAHLYRSDLAMQPNTSAYPMYNPTTPKNLLGFTENFNAASGARTNTTVTENAIVAPNGLQVADKIIATAVSGVHAVQPVSTAITTISGTPMVASVYAKAGEYSKVGIRENSATGAWATFSLSGAGSVIAQGTGGVGAITALSDGWYRISMTSNAGANFLATYSVLNDSYTSGSPSAYNYTGDGTSGIYLWGAQLSDSASLDPYVPVYGAAVTSAAYYGPRRDFDPVTLACKGLLVEEQRANLLLYSADFTQAAWTKFNLNTSGTPAWSNVAVAPDGTQTAEKLIANTTNSAHWVGGSATITSGLAYTVSAYVKSGADAGDYTFASLYDCNASTYIIVNLATGALVSGTASTYTITPVGSGWYRLSVTATSSSTTGYNRVYLYDGTNTNFAGNDAKGIYAWGLQLELGSFATSYIPTTSASATRSADVAQVGTAAFPYSATEGTLVGNFSFLGGSASTPNQNAAVSLRETGASSAIYFYNGGGKATAYCVLAGVDQAYLERSTVAAGVSTKLAFAFKANDFAASQDGGAVATDTSGTLVSPNVLGIGSSGASTLYLNGHIRQITYIPRRLSNTELQTRTA